jgi:3-methyladenine DNA glycosylase AlkD
MTITQIISEFEKSGISKNAQQMKRAGIVYKKAYGVRVPVLRQMAKQIKIDHSLALELWQNDVHEAKLLATMIADSKQVDELLMEDWVKDFYSWDICDQCIMNLFDKSTLAYEKAIEWSGREEEYVKRAGFAMMATLAVHDKSADNEKFEQFFPYIINGADDGRNFVKKAVNWALRQIGKRNLILHSKALGVSEKINKINAKSAQWIARDALRELNDEKILKRMQRP